MYNREVPLTSYQLHACLNNISIMTIATEKPMGMGKTSHDPSPRQRATSGQWLVRQGESVIRDVLPYRLSYPN